MDGSKPAGIIGVLPNTISAARIVVALVFPFVPESLRVWLIVGAGISDGLDGYLARRYAVTSWQGGILDAVADKLFTLSALGTFTLEARLPLWQLGVLLVRDGVVVSTAAAVVMRRRFDDLKRMQSRFAGKATTFCLFFLMTALALELEAWLPLLVGLSATSSFAAAADYGQSYASGRPSGDAPNG
ncbi:MAG: CDP-alcohol phosphatidyltransferase family protein [Myxococcales bacterium]|nr:CDP-alcohol phosphatidyltransferase family protein [Myxococcales bacterium]